MLVDAALEIVEHVLRRALLPYGDTADDGIRFRIVVKQEGKFGFCHENIPIARNLVSLTESKI